MKTNVTKINRVFDLTDLSEKEGLILRTLLNLNEKGVHEALLSDKHYWDSKMDLNEALAIGTSLCDKIMLLVDE